VKHGSDIWHAKPRREQAFRNLTGESSSAVPGTITVFRLAVPQMTIDTTWRNVGNQITDELTSNPTFHELSTES
jgi:hypothetical protein